MSIVDLEKKKTAKKLAGLTWEVTFGQVDRFPHELEGGELIEFADNVWKVDAVAQLPSGLHRVTALNGNGEGGRLQFDISTESPVLVWTTV